MPDPDTPAPVRFLPEYDNSTLGYADRSRILPDVADCELLQGGPGAHVGSLLVDGFVSALWALRRDAGAATLQVKAAVPIPAQYTDAIHAEGTKLSNFLAPDTASVIQWNHD